jgi:hypothetical protein
MFCNRFGDFSKFGGGYIINQFRKSKGERGLDIVKEMPTFGKFLD